LTPSPFLSLDVLCISRPVHIIFIVDYQTRPLLMARGSSPHSASGGFASLSFLV
jgi:hypothetical protein